MTYTWPIILLPTIFGTVAHAQEPNSDLYYDIGAIICVFDEDNFIIPYREGLNGPQLLGGEGEFLKTERSSITISIGESVIQISGDSAFLVEEGTGHSGECDDFSKSFRSALRTSKDDVPDLMARENQSLKDTVDETSQQVAELRSDLAETLRLQRAAEARAETQLLEVERQAALLSAANDELSDANRASAEAERRMAALTEQVSRLRQEVGRLEKLLDIASDRDAEREIENLGARLNAALIREAEEAQARAELEAAERERLERYQSEFFGRLRDLLGDREGIEVVGDRFVFDSEVLFPSGSADLSSAGRQQVARVAELLGNVSDDIPDNIDWVIRVDGHTDDVPVLGTGAFDDNWELSQARALSVVRYMSEDLGFPAHRLAPTGFGQFRPVDERQTPEARARNRRIELRLSEK